MRSAHSPPSRQSSGTRFNVTALTFCPSRESGKVKGCEGTAVRSALATRLALCPDHHVQGRRALPEKLHVTYIGALYGHLADADIRKLWHFIDTCSVIIPNIFFLRKSSCRLSTRTPTASTASLCIHWQPCITMPLISFFIVWGDDLVWSSESAPPSVNVCPCVNQLYPVMKQSPGPVCRTHKFPLIRIWRPPVVVPETGFGGGFDIKKKQ